MNSDFIRFFPIFRLFPTFRLLDSTTLIDIHQNMPISLTLIPFDHFQNMSSGGIGPDLILTLCHIKMERLTRMHSIFPVESES